MSGPDARQPPVDDLLAQRVAVLEALDAALSRRHEVMEAVWESASDDAAVDSVRRLLDCDEVAAQAVLDLQWRRLTRQGRERIARERDERATELGG